MPQHCGPRDLSTHKNYPRTWLFSLVRYSKTIYVPHQRDPSTTELTYDSICITLAPSWN